MNLTTTGVLHSDSLADCEGRVELRAFALEFYFKPQGGSPEGGDRFAVRLHEGGDLSFYLADASGHGGSGAQFWEASRGCFDELWQELVAGASSEENLVRFVTRVNDTLTESHELRAPHLCMVVGTLSPSGQLTHGTFGYGAHALVATAHGRWQTPPKTSFSLKLGWIPSERWRQIPGACVIHRVDQVKRLVLMTDGFLGDDYVDVDRTMRLVSDLADICARLPLPEVVPRFKGLPHHEDDASVIVLDVT